MKFKHNTYGYIATKELNVATRLISTEYEVSAGYSQQVVEKICKEYISRFEIGGEDERKIILKSHNMLSLLKFTEIKELASLTFSIREFNKLYYDTRYPGENFYEVEYEDSVVLLDLAKKIYIIVCSAIEQKKDQLCTIEPEDIINAFDVFNENDPVRRLFNESIK